VQTNSKDLGAFGRKQNLLVEVVEEGQVVGVYVDVAEDLPDSGHAPAGRTL
jgi:hypothetical protein